MNTSKFAKNHWNCRNHQNPKEQGDSSILVNYARLYDIGFAQISWPTKLTLAVMNLRYFWSHEPIIQV